MYALRRLRQLLADDNGIMPRLAVTKHRLLIQAFNTMVWCEDTFTFMGLEDSF